MKHEDNHLTKGDKIAIGIGIPVFIIALSTLGYWRAAKYFLHRKITGEPKLPVYGSKNLKTTGDIVMISSQSSFGGRSPSLWGASSKAGFSTAGRNMSLSSAHGDTELLTAPRSVYTPADSIRPDTSNTFRASNLREWQAV